MGESLVAGGRRPAALRIPQQSYNSAPVSSRGWGGANVGGTSGPLSPINAPGAPGLMTHAATKGGRHSSLGHTYGANQLSPCSTSPYGTAGGAGLRFATDSEGGKRGRVLEEEEGGWQGGGGMSGAGKTGPRTPGSKVAVKKRPSQGGIGGVARGLAMEDEFDDFSAPTSPQRGGVGDTAVVSAQVPKHMTGISAAHFPPAVSSHLRFNDEGAQVKVGGKKGAGPAKSQEALLARVAQLEASLSAMGGGGGPLGSPAGERSPGWKGQFKSKCHLDDDVRVLILKKDLKVTDLTETVEEEYGPGVRIKYKDAEGDLVTITTDKGLVLALNDHFASGADVLHLYLFTAQSPTGVFGAAPIAASADAGSNNPGFNAHDRPGASSKLGPGKYDEAPWDELVGSGSEHTGRTGGKGGLNAKAKQRQIAAAMKIQSVQRGHRARVEYRVLREHEEEALSEERAAEQAKLDEEKERPEDDQENLRREAEAMAAANEPVLAGRNSSISTC